MALQRKKAEKATADVLAILETHGISDVSESYYSSSDQEVTPRKLKVCNDSNKGGESSVNSKQLGNESEEFSGSEFDSAASGRNLSWKGRKDSSRSHGKYKDTSMRKRTSLATMSSSSKHRPGKSCRQIRHKDQRFVSFLFLFDNHELVVRSCVCVHVLRVILHESFIDILVRA